MLEIGLGEMENLKLFLPAIPKNLFRFELRFK